MCYRHILCFRMIEDKMGQLGIGLRDLRVPIDCSGLHGNADRPLFFHGWLAVPDSTLPVKGVAYRRNINEDGRDMESVTVNSFAQGDLWRYQGLPLDSVPRAMAETEFAVPSPKSCFVSADTRRNLTDTQETAQWIAGQDVFQKILKAAFGPLVGFNESMVHFPHIAFLSVYVMLGSLVRTLNLWFPTT